ncbi:MAG TPA: hypothetical protein VN154_00815 [Rhizomicrobium sp.]|nr:hypothetical protein [Rhizomicrobium sp.]
MEETRSGELDFKPSKQDEWTKAIRKLRWIGCEIEAERFLEVITRLAPEGSALAKTSRSPAN